MRDFRSAYAVVFGICVFLLTAVMLPVHAGVDWRFALPGGAVAGVCLTGLFLLLAPKNR
ncbi:MAG: hypothetical protein P8X75_03740 [Limibacillus sp.]|jgi:hypothetical protein